ncbi:MAG: ABC transporter permease [Chloroflexales bacterium]|nr:ABC transporter permease [Chloroflexales bacterium]
MFQRNATHKLLLTQAKLYLREPMAVFFTLLLAPLTLIVMGFIFGNEPTPMFHGRGNLDMNLPAYAAMVIGVVGITTVPIETSSRRENGVLRRFRATPLRPLTYLMSDVLVYFAMVLLGVTLLFVLGTGVYRVQFSGNLLALLGGICLSAAAFLALGYVIASLAPNVRIATVVGNILLIPMMMLSGVTLPLEMMPDSVRTISQFIPLTHVVTLLRGLWFGEPFSQHVTELMVLGGVLLAGTVVAIWTFRWE